jgi:hypothetical protein
VYGKQPFERNWNSKTSSFSIWELMSKTGFLPATEINARKSIAQPGQQGRVYARGKHEQSRGVATAV